MASTQLAQSVEFLSSSGLPSTQTSSSDGPNSWQLLDCWTQRLAPQDWKPPIETCFKPVSVHFGTLDWWYFILLGGKTWCVIMSRAPTWNRISKGHKLSHPGSKAIKAESKLRILEVTSCREMVFIKESRPTTTTYIAEDAWKRLHIMGFSSNSGSPKPFVSIKYKQCVHTEEFLR